MRFEPWVGLRYLGATRGRRAPSAITLISVFAVAVGVIVPILVLSVMGGFEDDLRTKILGSRSHLLLTGQGGDYVEDPERWVALLESQPRVVGVSPFVEADVMASSSTNYSGAIVRGVDVARVAGATDLLDYIIEGDIAWLSDPAASMRRPAADGMATAGADEVAEANAQLRSLLAETEALEAAIADAERQRADGSGDAQPLPRRVPPPVMGAAGTPERRVPGAIEAPRREPAGVLIGSEMQRTLYVDVGDTIQLINPDGDIGPTGPIPRSWPHRVVGIYHTGLYEFDSSVVYMTLDASRAFLNVPDGAASGIEVRSTDITEADLLAADVRTALMAEAATGVQVRDWKELNRNLFAALKLEKLAMSFVLLFIVVVASFAVFSVLVMIVLRRRDEIAILRAMGASQRAIRNVFIVQGMAIGASGTALGLAVSGAAVWVLVSIGVPLDAEVYYIDRLPVDVQGFEIAVIALGSLLISLVATIPPSVQAARLDPAQGLRHE